MVVDQLGMADQKMVVDQLGMAHSSRTMAAGQF
jgi:hypothetical protein